MTIEEFDHGYWYATELKAFATTIGIRAGTLRKDQLERAVRSFLATRRVDKTLQVSARDQDDVARDSDAELTMKRRVVRYTNDRATKDFLVREAKRLVPGLRPRSGARYRLNRWREEQLASGRRITYGDVVREYVRLCQSTVPFAHIPHGRYVNFVSDYSANEPNATRGEIIAAWHALKKMDCEKTYAAWAKYQHST
jgi:SAP domain-containing protein